MFRLFGKKTAPVDWCQQIVEALGSPLCATTPSGKIVWANRAFLMTTNCAPDDLHGRTVSELAHVSCRSQLRSELKEILASPEQTGKIDISLGRNGDQVFEAVIRRDTDLDNKPFLSWALRDVTEERSLMAQAQRELREKERLLETMPLEMWVTDLNEKLLQSNKLASQLFGIPTADKMTHEYEIEVSHLLGEASSGKGTMRHVVAHIPCPHDGDRWFLLDKLPYNDAQGIQVGWVYFARDITEAQRTENLLYSTQSDLEVANAKLDLSTRPKDHFTELVSHALHTPLNSILHIAETLVGGMDGKLNLEQEASIRTIHESGKHLLGLVNNIVDLSKVEAANLEVEPKITDLSKVLASTKKIIDPLAAKRKLTFEIEHDESVRWVLADAHRLQQILVNLLSNAILFTPKNLAIGLRIEGDLIEESVRFSVWDCGKGIPKDQVESLFQPIEPLDNGTDPSRETSGIGLQLTKGLAELHDGKIEVENRDQGGAEITVSLPWPATAREVEHSERILVQPSYQFWKTGDRPEILLAEDNAENQQIVSAYLNRMGYHVSIASNGIEALEMARKNVPDLILMNVQMPYKDGIQTIRELRTLRATKHLPIIALTGMATQSNRDLCLRAGADHFVSKPFDFAALANLIKGCLPPSKAALSA